METGTGIGLRLAFFLALGGAALELAACGDSREAPGGSTPGSSEPLVSITTEETHQTLEGFGASLAWYQEMLTVHSKQDELYPLLFGDLGLDIVRFRNRYQRTNEEVDLGTEKAILDAAEESLGHPPRVLLSSWSPPAAVKANGNDDCNAADSSAKTCTLRRVDGAFDYAGFVSYWADSLAEYAAAGIEPTWISIQNEPDFSPTGWEGCRFQPSETAEYPGYDQALAGVAAHLETLDNPPGLLGPETLGVHYGRVQSYLATLDHSLLAGVAHHIYEHGQDGISDWKSPGPDSYLDEMQGVGQSAGSLPTFQTEFNTEGDGGNSGGFETAWLIHNSLVQQDASAFLYWELIWSGGPTDRGLVHLDGTDDYTVRQHYYAVKHYSYFTEPGYVRVSAASNQQSVRSSAFLAPDESRLVIVVLNVSNNDKSVKLDLGSFEAASASAVRSVFEGAQAFFEASELGPENSLSLPPRSMASAVFEK